MQRTAEFNPDWATPPGATISDILLEAECPRAEFARRMKLTMTQINNLLSGQKKIDDTLAIKLESNLGGSRTFWLNRERQYRDDLKRLRKGTIEEQNWIANIPVRDMIKFGWINRAKNPRERLTSCLNFFGVSTIDDWYVTYNNLFLSAAFKTSRSFDSKPEAIITWLRQAEIESQSERIGTWNTGRFQKALIQARQLTRTKDPKIFIHQLKRLFAGCGVFLGIIPAPTGCRASGATYFLSPRKALMLLSFRYLSDDHFWFSLFHEAAHLILHENRMLFLEGIGNCETAAEKEANEYAENLLIPAALKEEFRSLSARNWRQIVRFARKAGVSPGIVVGQLQYHGIIQYNQLNKLKTRFRWHTEVSPIQD